MTKKVLFTVVLFITMVSGATFSQELASVGKISIAYVNTSEIMDKMPEKGAATQQLLTLSENYKKELELMQNEYNKKYSDYITYQSSLSENIKLRRMQELTELESKISDFMELAQKDIESQEKSMLGPLKQKIHDAIQAVGIEQKFTVIYDLANPGIAFVSPEAVNANPLVMQKLGMGN